MAKIRKGIQSFLSSLLSKCKKSLRYVAAAAAIMSAGYLVMNADQLQRTYVRDSVGPKVVRIVRLDSEGNIRGGGTGFQVKAPSESSKWNLLPNDKFSCVRYR